MGAFPQYSRHEFNFATESYGGHFGPIFNFHLEQRNALIEKGLLPGAHHIKLKTLLIGNGWYDPLVQYQAYYNFTVYPGNTYDYSPFNTSIQHKMYNALYGPGNCYDMTVDCNIRGLNEICAAADNFCFNEVEYVLDQYANRDEYDIRELSPDPFPPNFYADYLNTPRVQHALGAYVNFSSSSSTVSAAFGSTGDDDRREGTIAAVRALVDQGIYVFMFAGDADYNCNWLGGEVVSEMVEAPGFGTAGYTNICTSDGIVHGQVKQSGNFAFARIYESGHEVPFYQPVVALEMFERAIGGKDLAHGREGVWRGYKSVGSAESAFREGNGTVRFEVLSQSATYNITLDGPNPVVGGGKNATNGTVGSRGMEVEVEVEGDRKGSRSRRLVRPVAEGPGKRRPRY